MGTILRVRTKIRIPDPDFKTTSLACLVFRNKIFLDAAKRGDLEKMQKCITHGAQLNSRDEEGCTALHHAVRHAYDHIFDWLIQTG